jgi:ATP-binding cassette subfamily B protein
VIASETWPERPAIPYFPVAVDPRHVGPKGSISPDKSLPWMRRALPLVRAHKWQFGLALGLSFAAMVVLAVIPRVMMGAIDSALTARTSALWPYIAALVGLALARGALNLVSRYLLFKVAYDFEYDLRTMMYEHLSRLSFSFYDHAPSGQLISRANSDIRSMQMYLTFAPQIVLSCLSAVIAFAFMLSVDVELAFVSMAVMPFVFLAGQQLRHRAFPASWSVQSRLADVAGIVDESVNGVRVVKSFAAEPRQLSLLQQAARRVQWAAIREMDVRATWAPFVENLPRLGLALILLYGGYQAINGQISVGAIVAFNAYLLQLQAPFRVLGQLLMLGQRARASAQRIYEVLDRAPDIVDRPGSVDLVESEGHVEFDDVTFAYGDGEPVLRGLDLTLRPGETVAIVGRTGSGKSTIARLIPRYYDVAGGAVLVDGHDVRELTVASLRAKTGIVTEEPFLFSVSIRDNIAYGRPDAPLDDVVAAAKAAGAHDFITELPDGYDEVVGERGYTLSGGQRQRIAIARALVVNPPILILDDATSAIDVHVEERIHDALRGLMGDRTTVIIAHRLSTISLADRVVLLEGGRIVADGTHAELLAREPRYAEVLTQVVAEGSLQGTPYPNDDDDLRPPPAEEDPDELEARELEEELR